MDKNKLILSCKIPQNKQAIIRKLDGDKDFIIKLRELGFGEGKRVTKFSDDAHQCIIINMDGRKIYLTEHAAHCILVELV
jgi:Fe2+ transport system protein FeoA